MNEEHKLVRDSARALKREVSPIIEEYSKAELKQIIKGLGEIGGFGPYIPGEYGGAGFRPNIIHHAWRLSAFWCSFYIICSIIVSYVSYLEIQRSKKYLPKLATGEYMGCFGLTEPNYGSDPGSMITNFKDMGDYLLNGAKMWFRCTADITMFGQKMRKDNSRLIVERGMEGFTTPAHNKWSLRASSTELILTT
jgi:glutaryl-CoA dehydrogenase